MELSTEAKDILGRVSQTDQPVAMSSFFHAIHPPSFDRNVSEDDPARVEWMKLQLRLYRASVDLYEKGMVRVVHPANGERPDLVIVTDAGRAALI